MPSPASSTDTTRRMVVVGAGIGLGAGIISGLFGIGGGVVLVPLLVISFALPQLQAASVSLAAIVVGAGAGVVPFLIEGRVDWPAAAFLTVGAAVGAWIGALVVHRIPERVLAWTFVAVVVGAAVRMLIPSAEGGIDAVPISLGSIALLVAIGVTAGGLAAVLGIGGGMVYVPALVIFFGLIQHTAQGTSLIAILPAAAVGAWGHARAGRMDWRLAGIVSVGSFLGGFAGGWIAQLIPAERLQVAFGIFLVVMAVRMAIRTTRGEPAPTPPGPGAPPT